MGCSQTGDYPVHVPGSGDLMDERPDAGGRVRREFDAIARLPETGSWDHNTLYHPFLLRHLPGRIGQALEVGCGTGTFARALADRAERVVALDFAPEMIAVAREQYSDRANLEFILADALEWDYPSGEFDCVASIATLHHLPFPEMLARFEHALRPGGVLLVVDLVSDAGVFDLLLSAAALPVNLAMRLLHTGHLRESAEVRVAWDEHGAGESYLTLPEVRAVAQRVIPGARIRRHLMWRYSLIWRKMG